MEDSYGNRTAQTFSNSVVSNWVNYNPANNRITTATSTVTGYVYDGVPVDRSSSMGWDASGNTLYDGNNEYWYDGVPVNRSSLTGRDAEGQLCAVQSQALPGLPITQYVYDAEGARIAKGTLSAAPSNSTSLCAPPLSTGFTLSARYLVDQGGEQVTELSEQGGELWKHSNVFSAARLTATYDTTGLHFELADPLGTKRVQANIYGQIEMSWASLPFGDALTPILPPNPPSTADDATEHHFTQKERDNESNNDYFLARYYNSAIGRFTTPDWSAKVVPVPYAKLDNPQTLNLYAYVGNNPLVRIDLDGHYQCVEVGKDQKGMCDAFQRALNIAKNNGTGDTVAAAWAYGDANKANGITVRFSESTNKAEGGDVSFDKLDGKATGGLTVTFSAKQMDRIQAARDNNQRDVANNIFASQIIHEGSHVLDEKALINSGYNASFNISHRESEQRAYGLQSQFLEKLYPGNLKSAQWNSRDNINHWIDVTHHDSYPNPDSPLLSQGSIP
ncbi:MAG: RHS repeat-associated core domain-containing protein [Terracidiphilus sp.]